MDMVMKRLLLTLCLFTLLFACDEATQAIIDHAAPIRVSAHRAGCPLDSADPCYRIQEGEAIGSPTWKNLTTPIEGFTYEEGFVYLIVVRVERVEVAPSETPRTRYTLVKVLSKDKI
jgi:hypothetical protein